MKLRNGSLIIRVGELDKQSTKRGINCPVPLVRQVYQKKKQNFIDIHKVGKNIEVLSFMSDYMQF